jgi:hypothetical protein
MNTFTGLENGGIVVGKERRPMARNTTPGRKQINAEIPPELLERFDARAAECRRSRTEELILAMERHLAAPPAATTSDATGQKRGRPRGKGK